MGSVQRYILQIKMTTFMGSPWILYQDNARSISACVNSVFSLTPVDVTDWPGDLSPIENV